MAWRARYFLIGGVALITAVGPIGWQFLGGRGEVLKSDGGPIVTLMDFGPSFPLDPLPSGWRHRKFWTRSPMTMASASRTGCRACASRREACEGGDLGQSAKPGTINTSAAFRTLSPMPATIGSAAGSTRGSISSASMPRSGRMPHPRTWSMSPCSAIATTRTPPTSATSPMFGSNGGEVLAARRARRAPGCLAPQGGCCRTPQGSNLVEPASAIARGDDGGRRLAPTTAERTLAGRRSLPFLTRWAVPCSPDLIP